MRAVVAQLSPRPSRRRAVAAAVMLADMAAVTAVDARSMAASTVPVNSAAVSTPSATCAGSITPPTSINPPISALAGI